MKRLWLILLVILMSPMTTNAATVGWEKVTTFVGGEVIPSEIASTLVYKVYYGADKANLAPGGSVVNAATSPAPDPPMGETFWYSVTAAVPGGPESDKAVPVSKTVAIPPIPAPSGCTVK